MFGEAGPVADSQIILLAYNFFRELQIDVQIQINSIGCKECRPSYIKKLNEYYKERGKRSKICNDCKKRFLKNPLRLLDCKEEACQEVRGDAPQIVDSLCDHCRDHFIKVLEYLDELEIPYNLNPHLVRGLDYYTKTVFEVTALGDAPLAEAPAEAEKIRDKDDQDDAAPRRQSSLGGGGRYDSLVEYMGGRPTPACGFGIGLERVIMKIKENNIPVHEDNEGIIYIAQLGEAAKRRAFCLFEELRRGGIKVRQSFTKDALKNQLEDADRVGAKYALIIGQKELIDGTLIIRDMESGTQETIDCKKTLAEISRRLHPEA
jgi:histidyl-tRNA synthetase